MNKLLSILLLLFSLSSSNLIAQDDEEPFIFVFKDRKIIWSKNAFYEGMAAEIIDAAKYKTVKK